MSIYQITPFLNGIPKDGPQPTHYLMYGNHFLERDFQWLVGIRGYNLTMSIGVLNGWTWHMNEHRMSQLISSESLYKANSAIPEQPNIRPAFNCPGDMAPGPAIAPAAKVADQNSVLDWTFGLLYELTPDLQKVLAGKYEAQKAPVALDVTSYWRKDGTIRSAVVKALVYWDPWLTTDGLNDNIMAGALGELEKRKWKEGLRFLRREGVPEVWLYAILRRLAGERVDPEPLFWTETGYPTHPQWAREEDVQTLRREYECAKERRALQKIIRLNQVHQQQIGEHQSHDIHSQSESLKEPERPRSTGQRLQGRQPMGHIHDHRESLNKSERLGSTVHQGQDQSVRRALTARSPGLPTKTPGSSDPSQPCLKATQHIPPTPPMTSSPRPTVMSKAPDTERIEKIKARQEKNKMAYLQSGGRIEMPLNLESSVSSVQLTEGKPAQRIYRKPTPRVQGRIVYSYLVDQADYPVQEIAAQQYAAQQQARQQAMRQEAAKPRQHYPTPEQIGAMLRKIEDDAQNAGITVSQFVEKVKQDAQNAGKPLQPLFLATVYRLAVQPNKRKADSEIEMEDQKRMREQ